MEIIVIILWSFLRIKEVSAVMSCNYKKQRTTTVAISNNNHKSYPKLLSNSN